MANNQILKCTVNNQLNMDNKYIICTHCLKQGHIIKTCPCAVVSFGLICYYQKQISSNIFFNKKTRKQGFNQYGKYNSALPKIKILKRHETLNHTIKNMLGITGSDNNIYDDISIVEEQTQHITVPNDVYHTQENSTESVSKLINTNRVILVQRRNTIGFIEFLRGKYDVNNHEYIIKLFNMLSFDEKRILREYDKFDAIRTIIGLCRENIYKKEYDDAMEKFEALKNHVDGNMIFKLLDRSITKWSSPEWGLPKGRRKSWYPQGVNTNSYSNPNNAICGEMDIECAVREFVEETGIKYKNLIVYRNVKPLEELYRGINGVLYKHIYYLARIKDTEEAISNVDNVERGGNYNFEISNVKYFGLSECHRIIRPYYISKLNVIKKGFQLINCINQYFE